MRKHVVAHRLKVATEKRAVSALQPHKLNESIYGDNCCTDLNLAESIRVHGVLVPILITNDDRIVSGHRRWFHAKNAGLREVPVVVGAFDDELQIEEAIIEANRQREKTEEQKAREVRELKRIARKRAEARRDSKLKQNQRKAPDTDPEILPERGDSRDIAAASVGWSGKTGDKAVAVVDAIDQALESGDMAKAFELQDALNNQSVSAAHKKIAPVKGTPEDSSNEADAFFGPLSSPEWLPDVGEMIIGDYSDGATHGMVILARHEQPEFVQMYSMRWNDYDTGGSIDGLKRGIRAERASWVMKSWGIPDTISWNRSPVEKDDGFLRSLHEFMNPEYYHHKHGIIAKNERLEPIPSPGRPAGR